MPGQATIAEIIGVPPDPQRAAVILDKGTADGIAVGYAVVDASGLLGQITDVSANTSWALLVSDRNHATPAGVAWLRSETNNAQLVFADTSVI